MGRKGLEVESSVDPEGRGSEDGIGSILEYVCLRWWTFQRGKSGEVLVAVPKSRFRSIPWNSGTGVVNVAPPFTAEYSDSVWPVRSLPESYRV